MSTAYSGSLQIKKKAELQEIAQALAISDSGTREDLQLRIKKHLEDNSTDLENDPAFSGLYTTRGGRRQRSLQPSGVPSQTNSVEPPKFTAIPEEKEPTPPLEDLRDVSMMIPQQTLQTPVSSPRTSPRKKSTSPRHVTQTSSVPSSPARTLVAQAQGQSETASTAEITQAQLQSRDFVVRFWQTITTLRVLLSSGQNIFIISTVLDFLGIVYQVHVNSVFPIPPIHVSAEPALSTTLLAAFYWSLPSVAIPAIIGYFVSFSSPASRPRFDVLSAAIIRFAGNVPDFYPSIKFLEKKDAVQSLDVLGYKWRAVSSGISLAFAFAEAIVRRNNQA